MEAETRVLGIIRVNSRDVVESVRRARTFVIVLTLACIAPPACAQVEAHAAVDAASLAFDDLQFTQDRAGLEAVVARDLIYITGQGRLADREEFLAATLEPVSHLEPFEIRERQITMLGEHAAAVTGLGVVRGLGLDQRRFEITMRFLDLFSFVDGQWQVVLVQVTPVVVPPSW